MTHRVDAPNFFVCQQDAENHLKALADLLDSAGSTWTVYRPDEESPAAFNAAQHVGLIVLGGGKKSADHPASYLREKCWLLEAVNPEKPVLGICLGAQLLAHVRGGRVVRHERLQHKGWQRVIVTEAGAADSLLQYVAPYADMYQHHYDTYELPANAEVLAISSEDSEVRQHPEAFRIGRGIYGLQFHPEEVDDERKPDCSRIARKLLDAWIHMAIDER